MQTQKTKVIGIIVLLGIFLAGIVLFSLTTTQNQATQDSSAAVGCTGVQPTESSSDCYVPVVTQTSTDQKWLNQKTGKEAPPTLSQDLTNNFKDLFVSTTGAVTQVCKPKLPAVAKLVSPRNKTEITQPTVTIEWEKNGTFGKECKDNGKEDRFILKYAVVNKNQTCPAIGSKYKSRQLTVKVAGQKEYSVEISNLQHDKKYCWFIRAKNGETKSETKVRSFTTNLSDVAIQPSFPEETLEVVEGNTEIEVVSNNE